MWTMNGATITGSAGLIGADPNWSVSHTGDFNGDGKADLLWKNTNGAVTAWLMNGVAISSTAGLLGADANWSVSHLADFNGDGKADILWRNTNGAVTMWMMNGTTIASTAGILGADANWRVAQTLDLNGDNKADLVWRANDGSITTWLMNGATTSGTAGLLGPGSWNVAPNSGANAAPVDSPVVAAIDRNNRQAVVAAFQSIYVPTRATPLAITGLNVAACAAGDTTLAYKTAVVRMANYLRAMSGLPGNLTLNASWSIKAQQAALIMSANSTLSHTPPSSFACYSAAGAEAAGRSNLALGASALGGYFSAMDLYMSDNGVPSLGHRRWIIYPPQAEMGTGDTSNTNSLWVLGPFGARPATPNGVAWPPAGFVPYTLAPSSMTWSFSMDGANFASTTASVTKVGGAVVPISVTVTPSGYGDETIAFIPVGGAWPYEVSGDTSFDVQVRNVIVGAVSRNFSYRVTLISTP